MIRTCYKGTPLDYHTFNKIIKKRGGGRNNSLPIIPTNSPSSWSKAVINLVTAVSKKQKVSIPVWRGGRRHRACPNMRVGVGFFLIFYTNKKQAQGHSCIDTRGSQTLPPPVEKRFCLLPWQTFLYCPKHFWALLINKLAAQLWNSKVGLQNSVGIFR